MVYGRSLYSATRSAPGQDDWIGYLKQAAGGSDSGCRVVRAFEVLSLRSQNTAGELSPYLKGIWLLLAVKGDVDVRANEGGGTLKSLPMLRAPEALASGLWSDHVNSKAERFAIHLQRG